MMRALVRDPTDGGGACGQVADVGPISATGWQDGSDSRCIRAARRHRGGAGVGLSPDEPAKLRKFADKHGLDLTLVGDPDHSVSEAYGVWVEKSMYGKKYMGIQRATFIIDGSGTVAHVIPKASPKTHDDQVLAAL